MYKITMTDGQSYKDDAFCEIKEICQAENVDFNILPNIETPELVSQLEDSDALLVIYSSITKEVVKSLKKCKIIVRLGIGFDTVDLEACKEAGIAVCNVPDYGIEEVGLHALSLLLNCERKINYFSNLVKAGTWDDSLGYPMKRVSTRTLGIIGFGRTAQKLAHLAGNLDYKIITYDPYINLDLAKKHKVESVDLETLFKTADSIVTMAPLTKQTHHIINKESLSLMKDNVIIVNTGRGGLIDTNALNQAIINQKVAAAGLDVLEEEPIRDANFPILQHECVTVTPHAAFRSEESFISLKTKACTTAIDCIKNNVIKNQVN